MSEVNRIPEVTPIRATQCFRRLAGASQPQLMEAADGNLYVVKCQNNPQGLRILVNEMLGAALAGLLGLPVAPVAVIDLPETMVFLHEGMFIELRGRRIPCQPGLCFGSQFRLDARSWPSYSVAPEAVENRADFLGMLVFDKWASNTDGRQMIFVPNNDRSSYRAVMVDQGFCFSGEEWTFHNGALLGIAHFPRIYEGVTGLEDFEPWLTRLEREVNFEMLRCAAETVPSQWYLYQEHALNKLIWQLNERRTTVREMVTQTLENARDTFPNVRRARRVRCA